MYLEVHKYAPLSLLHPVITVANDHHEVDHGSKIYGTLQLSL